MGAQQDSSSSSAAAAAASTFHKPHVSLKSLVFHPKTGELQCSKTTYAQVCHVLDHQDVLLNVFEACPMPGITNHGLAMVLLYELLLGPNQALRGGGALKRMLLEKEDTLRRILTNMIEDPAKTKRDSPSTIERTLVDGTIVNARPPNNTPSSASSSSSPFPRYVRINTCRITTAEVVHKLQQYTKSIPSKPTSSTMDASNNTNKTMGALLRGASTEITKSP